jgi:pimeloyl-ACP methyl ester carboxylesterase
MCKIFNISKEELAEENIDMAELMLPFQEEFLKEYRKKIDSLMKSAAKSMYAPGNFMEDEYPENFLWSLLLGTEYGRPLPPKFGPYPLPEEELKKISTPTLLLIGEQEIIYDAEQAIKRAEELLENIQTALIPNANHMLNLEQTELVNSHILNFLSGDN